MLTHVRGVFCAACVLLLTIHLNSVLAIVAASRLQEGYGTCTGSGANLRVYNFEVNGFPAKVMNDLAIEVPVEVMEGGFFVEDAEVLKRALRRRYEDDSHVILDNNILYIDMHGEGVLLDTGNGPAAGKFGAGLRRT